ncbi:LuxR family transcriptional regulator [Novosphingobium sp. 9]|uniref:LuxR family transcriptional regulator n=1 Tax=Novosphingobium sp. 9 TaxID=2025349 RepID=UPI0021B64EDB|nr:autoinducer binding domain-containing protein [Novosphingobium sp. 9]
MPSQTQCFDMRLALIEALRAPILEASSLDELHEALARASYDMGFERFALALEIGLGGDAGTSLLVHDYPANWADVYTGFNLAATDPVRRAGEHSMVGFRWQRIGALIPLTKQECIMLEIGQQFGICDGFTVPRHLPGTLTGSCSFVTGSQSLPEPYLIVAEAVGAMALERASQLSGQVSRPQKARLTPKQITCLLWAARGKSDSEIANIEGISYQTAAQHLKDARLRYNIGRRELLIVYALFEGLVSYADIFRWRD